MKNQCPTNLRIQESWGWGSAYRSPNLTTAIQKAVEQANLGAATATAAFFRSFGGAVGVALSGAILTARLQSLMPVSSGF